MDYYTTTTSTTRQSVIEVPPSKEEPFVWRFKMDYYTTTTSTTRQSVIEVPRSKEEPFVSGISWTSPSCDKCPNHPKNGGSGICHCILGAPKVTC